ncbi:hypothetical protein M0R45_006947 [Rubus argutus]|uniref:Uncharacterized protein n=1 Tax=Rubus argutus TaxID=59490 RepID=A0AAW1YSE0_RUBAR
MLEVSLKFKKAFARLGDDEETRSQFLGYFSEPEEEYDEDGMLVPCKSKKTRIGPPCGSYWDKAEVFVRLLGVFYDVTLRVSASLYPTVDTTFHDVITMERNINSMMFKLRNVTHLLRRDGLEEEEVQKRIKQLKEVLMSLYEEYSLKVDGGKQNKSGGSPTSLTSAATSIGSKNNRDYVRGELLDDWRRVVEKVKRQGDDLINLEYEPTIEELEFYEKVKEEYATTTASKYIFPPPKAKGKTKIVINV